MIISMPGFRPTGTFDQEFGLRTASEKLWNRQANFARKMGTKWERESKRSVYIHPSRPASRGPLPPVVMNIPKAENKTSDQASICSTVVDDQDKPVEIYPPKVELKAMGIWGTSSPGGPPGGAKEAALPAGATPVPDKTQPEDGKEDQASSVQPQDGDKGGEATQADNEPPSVNRDTELALLSSGLFCSRLPRVLQRWSSAIFGNGNNNNLSDSESRDLEVWAVPAVVPITGRVIRVPFGHKAVKKALQRVLRNSKDGPLGVFTGMTQTQQAMVANARMVANQRSPHVRTCIGFHEIKKENQEPTCLIFFSLSQPELPIRLKDAVGRMHEVPYDVGRTWKVSLLFSIWQNLPGISKPLIKEDN